MRISSDIDLGAQVNWTEKLSFRKAIGLLVGAAIYGMFGYALSKYFYPVCTVPYQVDMIFGPGIPLLVFVGFVLLNMTILNRFSWFASRESWTLYVAAPIA